MKRLFVYVCGDSGPFDELNPFFVARQKLATELLYILNKHPMGSKQVCSALKISPKQAAKLLDSWAGINAVREEQGIYHVNFSIFTKQDLMILSRVSEKIACKLADGIGDHAKTIVSLARNLSAAKQVQTDKLLFAALGCFTLDWLGLKTLEEERLLAKNKPQPGNRSYLLFAREEVNKETAQRLYDKMYWGSHSDRSEGYVFTSFGDHQGIRYAFPDILWTLQGSPKAVQTSFKSPSWMTRKLSAITQLFSKKMSRDIASLLSKLNTEGPISAKELTGNNAEGWLGNLVQLLEDMNYILSKKGKLKLNYPVFADDDKKIIEQLSDIVLPSATSTIRQNHLFLEKAISNTAPMQNEIPINEVLNEAWHWIFAQTNKTLAEKGFLYDPPRKRTGEARHIAWIANFGFP